MRNTFSKTLYECAVADPSIYIVVADISPAGPMAEFQKHAPARFINVGVAEQVMIGMCAGLALKGCQPFAYTIATFALYRPFEMVRDDLGYQNLAGHRRRHGRRRDLFDARRHPSHHGGHRGRERHSQFPGAGALRSAGMHRGDALVRQAEGRPGLSAHRQGR